MMVWICVACDAMDGCVQRAPRTRLGVSPCRGRCEKGGTTPGCEPRPLAERLWARALCAWSNYGIVRPLSIAYL